MPKVFLDYVGMGDSDKPKDYAYSTSERTDLVEAIWRDFGVQSTTLVAFDFSSHVVLEHLRRRLQRAQRGKPAGGPDIHGVLIFNGGLFTDGHSHPWYTTPMLRRLPQIGQNLRPSKGTIGKSWEEGDSVSEISLPPQNTLRAPSGV
jgi:pimeloyl-ACP methyl ester carboxylesterase